jgi:hypothetical protein
MTAEGGSYGSETVAVAVKKVLYSDCHQADDGVGSWELGESPGFMKPVIKVDTIDI